MFFSVSRREAIRKLTAAAALIATAPATAEEWGEGSIPPEPKAETNTAPDNAPAGNTVADAPSAPPVCKVSVQSVEGPFYFDPKLVRDDITEAESGSPLNLAINVIDAATCLPIAGARVDVWHANAAGLYSGFASQGDQTAISTKGRTFLRGTQLTRNDGDVLFLTIYPGWYRGRAPHIHAKIILEDHLLATAQIYFPEILSQRIYGEHEPYNARGGPDTPNSQDRLFAEGGGNEGQIIAQISAVGDTITASLTIAVDKSNASAKTTGGFLRYLRDLLAK